jgi:hypothetical protein
MRNLRVYEANLSPGQQLGEGNVELVFSIPATGNAKEVLDRIMRAEKERWGSG